MRSSLDLVSFGRIHHFYLRHNADSERTSSRLRGQCRFFLLQKESLLDQPALQRRDPWGERPGEFEEILGRRLRLEAGI